MDLLLKFPFCNLSCKYCLSPYPISFTKIQLSSSKMESIKKGIEKIAIAVGELNHNLDISLHGGEFTLLSEKNLEDLLKFFKGELGVSISLQTNATLIDENLAYLLWKYDVSVGVSLDGPKDIHDFFRVYPNGRGSFDDVIRGIKHLRKFYKENEITGIAVITKLSLGREEEIYSLYESLGINLQLSFLVPIGRAINLRDYLLNVHDLKLFVERITRIWKGRGYSIKLYPHLSVIGGILTGRRFCSYSPVGCYSIVSYDIIKDVLGPCPELSFLKPLRIKINNSSVDDIKTIIKKYFGLKTLIEGVKSRCSNCLLFNHCGGGCLRETYAHTGDITSPYPYCAFRKWFIPYILNFILREVKSYGNNPKIKRI